MSSTSDDDELSEYQMEETEILPYKHITSQNITDRQDALIHQLVSIAGVEVPVAQLLLVRNKWNLEQLLEDYNLEVKAGSISPLGKGDCQICGSGEYLFGIHKQHSFCQSCFQYYCYTQIDSRLLLTCASCQDTIHVDDQLKKFLGAEYYQKYTSNLVTQYVQLSSKIKYCPHADCEGIVETTSSTIRTVECINGHKFCFKCQVAEDHLPAPCHVVRVWLKKCADDSETSNWMSANTKECTKCNAPIEKNGGCNHMTCKTCHAEFCWICLGPWSEHQTSYYQCNRFNEKTSVDARDAQSKSRAALERYLFYYNRYVNHGKSAQLAIEFYTQTEKKMLEMQLVTELSWIEVQFMKKALSVLLECRQTLKWTYGMGYYMKVDNQTALFEDIQRDLEVAVEQLNEMIEQPAEILQKSKQQILDKTEYCARRRDVVLRDCQFDEDRFQM